MSVCVCAHVCLLSTQASYNSGLSIILERNTTTTITGFARRGTICSSNWTEQPFSWPLSFASFGNFIIIIIVVIFIFFYSGLCTVKVNSNLRQIYFLPVFCLGKVEEVQGSLLCSLFLRAAKPCSYLSGENWWYKHSCSAKPREPRFSLSSFYQSHKDDVRADG